MNFLIGLFVGLLIGQIIGWNMRKKKGGYRSPPVKVKQDIQKP